MDVRTIVASTVAAQRVTQGVASQTGDGARAPYGLYVKPIDVFSLPVHHDLTTDAGATAAMEEAGKKKELEIGFIPPELQTAAQKAQAASRRTGNV